MKIKDSTIHKTGLIIGLFFISLLASATDITIRKDNPTPPPDPIPLSSEFFPVSATVDNQELAVYFEWSVGNATIAVYDSNNQVVHQETVNTDSTTELFVPTDFWASGNYTIKINYGTTYLIGEFTLE